MAKFVTTYDPKTALDICVRIAEGETLKAICEEGKNLPARPTFYRWLAAYPELSRAYATARELSAYSLEEEALDIAREVQKGKDFPEGAGYGRGNEPITVECWSQKPADL